jgi:hypothetical protein
MKRRLVIRLATGLLGGLVLPVVRIASSIVSPRRASASSS